MLSVRSRKDDSFLSKYGKFISRHPWEVIILSIVFTSIVLIIYSTHSHPNMNTVTHSSKSESISICIVKLLAVVSVYIELRRLINIPNKFIIGFIIISTFLTCFTFACAVFSLFTNELSSLNKAMPFFMVLVDISKPSTLVIYTLNSEESSLSSAIARLGPSMIQNALIEAAVIGSGYFIGNYKLIRDICLFGAFLVIISTIAFLSFFASCLVVISEIINSRQNQKTDKKVRHKTCSNNSAVQGEDSSSLRIHFIISILILFASQYDHFFNSNVTADNDLLQGHESYTYKIWRFSLDDFAVIVVIFMFTLKYVFYDSASGLSFIKLPFCKKETKLDTLNYTTTNDCKSNVEFETNTCEKTLIEQKSHMLPQSDEPLSLEEMKELILSPGGYNKLSDQQILSLLKHRMILSYKLESILCDYTRAISIRRQLMLEEFSNDSLKDLPYLNYDHYNIVDGACCENVIGFIPVPLGVAGPLLLDGKRYMVPMATTEGCLVASVNRGLRALTGGVVSVITRDAMTRAPVVRLESVERTSQLSTWLDENFSFVERVFNSSSRFCRLRQIFARQAGRMLFIRFAASTGDAMGMNMISKCTEISLMAIKKEFFPSMQIISLSGNFCSDKKPASINWIEGRGKSVVCEATVPASVVSKVLKTTVESLVELNISKNLIGSSMAGSVGGFNAHAANIVTAIYIATGQDPAQNISSSNCLTLVEFGGETGHDLLISCTMPSIECGTVGGGTILPPQKTALSLLGVAGASKSEYGGNAKLLARIVCATVMAGELSLLSALSSGDLVQGHMRYNRSQAKINE